MGSSVILFGHLFSELPVFQISVDRYFVDIKVGLLITRVAMVVELRDVSSGQVTIGRLIAPWNVVAGCLAGGLARGVVAVIPVGEEVGCSACLLQDGE